MLAGIDTSEDENCRVHDDRRVTVAGFGPDTFQPTDFKPELRGEAVLVNVVHSIVAIPSANDKHRVVTDNSRMAEPIQRLSTCSLDLLPFELFVLQSAPPKIVEALSPVVSREDVD